MPAASARYEGEAIEVSNAFKPFTSEELGRLSLFAQHVADIDGLDLPQRPKLTLLLGEAAAMPDVSRDNVLAIVIAYRKFVSEKDPANFNRIRNMIARHAREAGTADSATVLAWLANIEAHLKDVRRGPVPPSEVAAVERHRKVLQPPEVIDWLVNGVVAHSDWKLRHRWEELGGWSNHAMLWLAISAIADELKAFRAMDQMVSAILAIQELRA